MKEENGKVVERKKITVKNVDNDTGRLSSSWNAGIVAGIGRHSVADEKQVLQSVLTCFDRHFPSRQRRHDGRLAQKARLFVAIVHHLMLLLLLMLLVLTRLVTISSATTEYLQSFVPGEMRRWFGHVFSHARQANVASTSDVHLRTSVDVSLRY